MTKNEAQKAVKDIQRNCREIYDLFAARDRECPESLQEIYNQSIVLDGTIDRLPDPAPAPQPTPTTGA